jgi:hypothetical protein
MIRPRGPGRGGWEDGRGYSKQKQRSRWTLSATPRRHRRRPGEGYNFGFSVAAALLGGGGGRGGGGQSFANLLEGGTLLGTILYERGRHWGGWNFPGFEVAREGGGVTRADGGGTGNVFYFIPCQGAAGKEEGKGGGGSEGRARGWGVEKERVY